MKKEEAKEEVIEEKEQEEVKEEKKEKKKEKSEKEVFEEKLKEQEDKFLRLAAEYDNFRKRSAKEKSEIYSKTQADVVKSFLPIIDNFERARANSDASEEDYKKGIELIFNQFIECFDKLDVKGFGERGEDFDPNFHSAVMMVEDEELESNKIAQVFSKGYKLGDTVIRPAVVQVVS